MGFLTKSFAEKVHADEILQCSRLLGKLLEHSETAETELIELFQLLDNSVAVNLRKLKDPYV